MRKLLFLSGFFIVSIFSFAGIGKYKVNDAAVDQIFSRSEDISLIICDEMVLMSLNQPAMQAGGGGQTVGGFLIRDFFCGFIALHRSYMGSYDIWWKYCFFGCIPIVGGLPPVIDFFWVLFDGHEALDRYKGNNKFLVFFE